MAEAEETDLANVNKSSIWEQVETMRTKIDSPEDFRVELETAEEETKEAFLRLSLSNLHRTRQDIQYFMNNSDLSEDLAGMTERLLNLTTINNLKDSSKEVDLVFDEEYRNYLIAKQSNSDDTEFREQQRRLGDGIQNEMNGKGLEKQLVAERRWMHAFSITASSLSSEEFAIIFVGLTDEGWFKNISKDKKELIDGVINEWAEPDIVEV